MRGASWPCGGQEAADSPHIWKSRQGLVIPGLQFLSPSTAARAVLLPFYLLLPIPSLTSYCKARVRFMAFPLFPDKPQSCGYWQETSQMGIKSHQTPAGNGTASWNPKSTSPLIYPLRILAVECFMLFFWQISGNFLLISPEGWWAESQTSFCSLAPWNAICPDETAGPLGRGSTPLCPYHPFD